MEARIGIKMCKAEFDCLFARLSLCLLACLLSLLISGKTSSFSLPLDRSIDRLAGAQDQDQE